MCLSHPRPFGRNSGRLCTSVYAVKKLLTRDVATGTSGNSSACPKPALAAAAVSLILVGSLPFLGGHLGQHRIPRMVVAGGDEVSLAANLDFLKHLDLLEEVDVLEQFDPSP